MGTVESENESMMKIFGYLLFSLFLSAILSIGSKMGIFGAYPVSPSDLPFMKVTFFALIATGIGAFTFGTLVKNSLETKTATAFYVLPYTLWMIVIFITEFLFYDTESTFLINYEIKILSPAIILLVGPVISFFLIEVGKSADSFQNVQSRPLNIKWKHWVWLSILFVFPVSVIFTYFFMTFWVLDSAIADPTWRAPWINIFYSYDILLIRALVVFICTVFLGIVGLIYSIFSSDQNKVGLGGTLLIAIFMLLTLKSSIEILKSAYVSVWKISTYELNQVESTQGSKEVEAVNNLYRTYDVAGLEGIRSISQRAYLRLKEKATVARFKKCFDIDMFAVFIASHTGADVDLTANGYFSEDETLKRMAPYFLTHGSSKKEVRENIAKWRAALLKRMSEFQKKNRDVSSK